MEFPMDFWEAPPGLAVCPLHIVASICSQIHRYLSLSPDNMVVSGHQQPMQCACARTCTSPTTIAHTGVGTHWSGHTLEWAHTSAKATNKIAARSQAPPVSPTHAAHVPLQVLHARTCTKTERYLVQFFAACHLVYSAGFENVRAALAVLPQLGGGPAKGVAKRLFGPEGSGQVPISPGRSPRGVLGCVGWQGGSTRGALGRVGWKGGSSSGEGKLWNSG
jgi:hypothetical protein